MFQMNLLPDDMQNQTDDLKWFHCYPQIRENCPKQKWKKVIYIKYCQKFGHAFSFNYFHILTWTCTFLTSFALWYSCKILLAFYLFLMTIKTFFLNKCKDDLSFWLWSFKPVFIVLNWCHFKPPMWIHVELTVWIFWVIRVWFIFKGQRSKVRLQILLFSGIVLISADLSILKCLPACTRWALFLWFNSSDLIHCAWWFSQISTGSCDASVSWV